MLYVVHIKFLPGGSISPEEFFSRVNARWSWTENANVPEGEKNGPEDAGCETRITSAVCIADLESIERFSLDVSIMPGAGIYDIEIFPLTEYVESRERADIVR